MSASSNTSGWFEQDKQRYRTVQQASRCPHLSVMFCVSTTNKDCRNFVFRFVCMYVCMYVCITLLTSSQLLSAMLSSPSPPEKTLYALLLRLSLCFCRVCHAFWSEDLRMLLLWSEHDYADRTHCFVVESLGDKG